MSLVMEGSDMTVEQMIKTTKRGLLVTFFWYIRAVDSMTLLNTGMTRDGLFLIENGEIAGPVQNFRWNKSPLVGFNNITAVGQARADAHRRGVRRPRHGAGAADADRRLHHDVDFAGGVDTARLEGRGYDAGSSQSNSIVQVRRASSRLERQGHAMKRRDFVKTVAMSGMAVAASDLVGDLIAQSPQGTRPRVEVQGPLRHRAARSQARSAAATPTSASPAT